MLSRRKGEFIEHQSHCYEIFHRRLNINTKTVKKDSTLQKFSCDHYSKIARFTEEVAYLRKENRTKNCIIQTLLENDNRQQKPPAPNKSDFKVANKYVQRSKNYSASNTYISTSNGIQKNNDIENESNTGDCVKLTNGSESNKTNSSKINNSDTRKKISKSNNPPSKARQHVKKYDNVTIFLGDARVRDLKRWGQSNNKQKVLIKSFRGTITSHMHWDATPTIK